MAKPDEKKPFSFKVDDETRNLLKRLQDDIGTGQKFGEAIVQIFTEQRLTEEGEQPASKEIRRVRSLLSDVKHILESTLILAETDKVKAQTEAQELVNAQREKLKECRQDVHDTRSQRDKLDKDNEELQHQVRILEQQTESVQALKEAWGLREAELAGQVETLTATAAQVVPLDERVKELERAENELGQEAKTLRERREQLIATVQAKDSEIATAKEENGRMEKEASALRKKVRQAEKAARESMFDKEKAALVLKNREAEIRQEMTEARVEEMKRYEGEIATLNGRIQALMQTHDGRIQKLMKGHEALVGELNGRIQVLMEAKSKKKVAPSEKPAS